MSYTPHSFLPEKALERLLCARRGAVLPPRRGGADACVNVALCWSPNDVNRARGSWPGRALRQAAHGQPLKVGGRAQARGVAGVAQNVERQLGVTQAGVDGLADRRLIAPVREKGRRRKSAKSRRRAGAG